MEKKLDQTEIKKILVVDDEETIVKLVCRILGKEGYQTVTANNGKKGMGVFEAEKPDLVITDIVMPDMEGIEFIIALNKKRKKLPIIVMSGNQVGTKFLKTASLLGASATLLKPFSTQQLLDSIAEIEKRILS